MNKKIAPYLLVSPVLIIVLYALIIGISSTLAQSLGYFPVVGLREVTLSYYKEILQNVDFIKSFKFTLYISIISSILSVMLGILFSYSILKRKNCNKIFSVIYKSPIVVPHTVVALIIISMFSDSGIVSRLLYCLNIIKSQSSFPNLLFDRNGIGIIMLYIWKEVPFIAMVVYGVMSNISEELKNTAMNLGASSRQAFLHVILPLSVPTIYTTFLIVFAYSFGSYEVPYLLGPTTPNTLPVKAYLEYTSADLSNRPYSMAINAIMTLVSFFIIMLYDMGYKIFNKYKL